jgi:hypothetical protein
MMYSWNPANGPSTDPVQPRQFYFYRIYFKIVYQSTPTSMWLKLALSLVFSPWYSVWSCSSLPCVLHVRSSRASSFSYTNIIRWTIQVIEHIITSLVCCFILLRHKYSSHSVFRRSTSFPQSDRTKMHVHVNLDLTLEYCVYSFLSLCIGDKKLKDSEPNGMKLSLNLTCA